MSKSNRIRGLAASGWVALAFAAAVPVNAWAQIEEVVVTTRKREENLQDIPIAVSAITSEQIQRQGLTELKNIVENEPSVQFDQSFGPSDNRITIRGLSNTRGRSNVAFLVDGIDVTTENLVSAGSGLLANRRLLNDVERIEVVKGPQNALFGRAAFAGAIAYVTKDPGDEFNGRVGLDIAQYGQTSIDAAFGGPLSDTFGVRLSGVSYHEDGYYTNTILGTDVGGNDGFGGALTAVWQPTDAFRVRGRIEYSEENFDPRAVANVQGDKAYELPDSAKSIVQPIVTGNPNTQRQGSSATNLYNFGTYCPKSGFDPTNPTGPPAFCLPSILKDADGLVIAQSEDPNTGRAYPGTDTETFGASLQVSFDLGYGSITSYTGWIDFNSTDMYDQDYQASVAADLNGNGQQPYVFNAQGQAVSGRIDTLLSAQEANQDSYTNIFSQELRYATQLDGPVQFTAGVLYWQDHRVLQERNWITGCAPYGRGTNIADLRTDPNDPQSPVVTTTLGGTLQNPTAVKDPTTGSLNLVSGICDGQNNTLTSYQAFRRQFSDPLYSAAWDGQTRSWSFYGQVLWNLTDTLTMTFEDRFVNEDFTLAKPAVTTCTEIAFAQGLNATSVWGVEDPALCDAERVILGINPPPIDANSGLLSFRYLEGSESSSFNTPKLTLQWIAADGVNFYFSYAFAEKPGGINQLSGGGGGAPPSLDAERFDPEKLKAWEVGVKTNFEAKGFWQLNGSLFLQDYTDKQVGIQTVNSAGIAAPAVVNASGAQVWGLEIEALWQPDFMEGLSFSLSGTLLDAEYTDWIDDTRNLVKAAAYGDCPLIYKLGDQESTNPLDFPITYDTQPSAFCRLDYSGNKLERTPEQSWVAAVNLQRPLMDTGFDYLVEVNGSWQDERFADPENLVKLADYALMNVRLGITSPRWDVIAFVDNLLDDNRIKTAGSGPDFGSQLTDLGFTAGFGTSHYFATLPDPRVFGVRASYRFGSSAE